MSEVKPCHLKQTWLWVSRTVKGLGLGLTCVLPGYPATGSWMLPAGEGLPRQRQRTLFLTAVAVAEYQHFLVSVPPSPSSHRVTCRGPGDICTHRGFSTGEDPCMCLGTHMFYRGQKHALSLLDSLPLYLPRLSANLLWGEALSLSSKAKVRFIQSPEDQG